MSSSKSRKDDLASRTLKPQPQRTASAASFGLCSVLVPTLNRRERLLRTLACIQAQTYENIEIIVSDDGSSDGTSDAVLKIGDRRLKVVRSPFPRGVASARNRAAASAQGAWLAVCDDDDLWTPTKLGHQLALMIERRAAWSYCYAALTDDHLRILREDEVAVDGNFMRRLSSGNLVPGGCSTVIVRRDLFELVGGFDPAFDMFADWDLWLRLAEVELPLALASIESLYVQHGEQMSNRAQRSATELALIRTKHEAHRRIHGVRYPEGINWWVASRLWREGFRAKALRVWLGPKPLSTLAAASARVPDRIGAKLRAQPPPPPPSPEALAARDAVLEVLAAASSGQALQTPEAVDVSA